MSGYIFMIWPFLTILTAVPSAICQGQSEATERPAVPGSSGTTIRSNADTNMVVPNIGLCRDGWSRGTMKEMFGKEIPICVKVNPKADTWQNAQTTCRKHYGFLLKLGSNVQVNNDDLYSLLDIKGINRFWTGMHTEHGHLVWDDLLPYQVRPYNSVNATSTHIRPWLWENELSRDQQQYCGQLHLESDDDERRRRRKRSPDDDSNDNIFPGLNLANFRHRMNNAFGRRTSRFPPTSAFQTLLARTQMSDQLAELPGALDLQDSISQSDSNSPDSDSQNSPVTTDAPSFGPMTTFDTDTDSSSVVQFGAAGAILDSDSNGKELLNSLKEVAATLEPNMDENQAQSAAAEDLINIMSGNTDAIINDIPSNFDITQSDTESQTTDTLSSFENPSHDTSVSVDKSINTESEIIDKVTDVTSSPLVTSVPDDESNTNIGDILSTNDDSKLTGSELLGAVTAGSDDVLSNIGDSKSSSSSSDDSKTSSDVHGTDIIDTVVDNLNDSPTDMTDIVENVVDSILPSTDENIGDVSSLTLNETPSHTNDAIDDLISSPDNELIPDDGILSDDLAALTTDDIVSKSVDSADGIKDIVSDIKSDITEGILDDSITPLDNTVPESNVDDVVGSDDQIVSDLPTDDVSESLPGDNLSEIDDVIGAVDLENGLDETMNPMVTSDDGITDIGNIDISDGTGEFSKLGDSKLGESDLSEITDTIQDNLESNSDSLSEISDTVSDNDLHDITLPSFSHDTADTFDIDTNTNTGDLIDSLTDNDQTLHDVVHDISSMETTIDDNGNEESTNDDASDNLAEMSDFLTPDADVSTSDGELLKHNEVELDSNEFVQDLVNDVNDNDLFQDVIDAPDSITDVDQGGKDGIEDYEGTTTDTELADETETKRDLEWPDGSEWENDDHDANSGKLGTTSDDTEPGDGNDFNQDEFKNRQAVVDGSFEFSNNDDPSDETVSENDGSHDYDDYESDANDLTTASVPDSRFDDREEGGSFDGLPDMSEDIVAESEKYAISPNLRGDMKLSSCEVKLPSVCFSYEVLVSKAASTCEDGWYGHVSLDTCYKVLGQKMSYSAAVANCKKLDARVIIASTEFERKYSLMAVQLDGAFHRGEKFWMESPNEKTNCKLFSERGVEIIPSCRDAMNVICVKDAKPLSVYSANQIPVDNDLGRFYDENGDYVIFSSDSVSNNLPCRLTSAVSEFPVLWYKDGVLVSANDRRASDDLSLHFNDKLLSAFRLVTDRSLTKPTLQGQYWCEVWDRQTLTRTRSRAYNVRFSDVISFHGSMEVGDFSEENEVLFNMMNRKFPKLSAAEADIQKVFNDVLPSIKAYVPNIESVSTYIDGVRSNPTVVEYHAFFTMSRDYTSNDEQLVYSRLKAGLRSKLGNRNYIMDLPGRTQIDSFRTMSLQSTVSCPAASLQTSVDIYGQNIPVKEFSFPTAKLGEFANSLQNCSQMNTLPAGSARCLGDFYTGAYWSEVVANECVEEFNYNSPDEQKWAPSPYTAELTSLAKAKADSGNAERLVSEVAQIAKVAPKFTPTDINKIADVLEHTTNVRNLPKKVGENVLKTIDRLMTDTFNEAHVANVETKAANRIIKCLDRFAENADLGTKKQVRFVSDNVAVEIWDLKQADRPVIGLAVETKSDDVSEPFKTESIATLYNKSHLYDANVDAAIELPEEVFSKKEKGARVSDRLTMIVFRKSELFQAAITDGGRRISPTDQQMSRLNSYVISASIAGKKIEHLNERVKCIFKPKTESDGQNKCVWWDFAMNGNKGGWSNKGCVYDGMVNGRDVCLCDHLTNFAVLIDFYGQGEPIPDHHELSLSIITVLGLSCSILGLSLTIISFMFFRKLRKGRAQQTLFNLSLSLLLSMLVFLVGVKQTHNDYVCIIVAILLHYLILVSFMWMLMEAILQYLTFVKILGTYITRFMLKTVVPAWGLPLLPVISVLSIDYTLYKGGPNYCWMDLSAFYYAFAVPITCIIVINITIFIVTIISIFRRGKGLRSNQKKQKMAMTNLQAAITSFILLGLTWIFGYLAISDARLLFQYVFTILNSLQGFFIFVLFVVRKKKVRDQWYIICCKGNEKDRVSRSLSASNSIPSTYSNGSRNSRKNGRERDRSDSTKTIQSTYSNSSNGFTNYGYDHSYEFPFNRQERRAFRNF